MATINIPFRSIPLSITCCAICGCGLHNTRMWFICMWIVKSSSICECIETHTKWVLNWNYSNICTKLSITGLVIKQVNSKEKKNKSNKRRSKNYEIQWLLTQLVERSAPLRSTHHAFKWNAQASVLFHDKTAKLMYIHMDTYSNVMLCFSQFMLFVSDEEEKKCGEMILVFGSFCRRLWRLI